MKNYTILKLTIICLLFFNCSSENIKSNEEGAQLFLKKITVTSPNPNAPCNPGTEIYFDTNARINEIFICDEDTPNKTYYFDDAGNPLAIISTNYGGPTFIYVEGILTERSSSNDNSSNTTSIEYENEIIREVSITNGNVSPFVIEFVFEDNTYQKLLSIVNIDNSNNEEIISKISYAYEGENVIEILEEHKDESTNQLLPYKKRNYIYDNKKNPFKLGLPQNKHLAYHVNSLGVYESEEFILSRASNNNITQVTSYFYETGNTSVTEYNYQYNNDSYPLECSININGETSRIEAFEYY